MTSVRFQVVFSSLEDFYEIIINVLKEVYKENYDEFDEIQLLQQLKFQYTKKIEENKYLVGFEIEFDEIGQIIGDFSSNLQDLESVDVIFKYNDEHLLDFIILVHKELFRLEMKLREAISYIFIDTYKEDYYDFLKDINITPHFEGSKNLQKDKSQREEFLRKRYENEFFHILFEDYIKLSNPKTLKQEDLFLITEFSENFEDFKKNIIERGIIKSEYKTFIEEIKNIIEPISRIRNCIAHNRMLSSEDAENYQTYFKEINKYIDGFLALLKVTYFCPKCGGDIEETQETIYGGHGEDQEPVAIKQRVGCSKCDYTIHDDTINI